MSTEFKVLIRDSLLKAGLSSTREVFESEDTKNFGNVESIWVISNLQIRFVKDRGQVFIDIGSIFDKSKFFIFDDVALLMKWQALDDIIKATEPLDLLSSLIFIKQNFNKLELLLSKKKLKSTTEKINTISNKKTQARFG